MLTSPRLVGVASVAAAVALGWLAAPQVPGLMSGNPATSAGRASKSSSPADYAVATSVKLAGGGELVLSTPRSAYRPGETVPVQLALRGTTLVPGQVTVVAAGPSGSLTVYQSESGGDAPVAIMAVPQSRASGALSSQSQGPSGPRDQDLFDFNWTAASASGQALASGTYQLRARLILSDGETVELSLPVTVSAGG